LDRIVGLLATQGAVEQIVGGGLLCFMGHDDPAEIVIRLAFNAELEAAGARIRSGGWTR